MGIKIDSFPVLNDIIRPKFCFQTGVPKVNYTFEEELRELEVQHINAANGNFFKLSDKKCVWTPDNYGFLCNWNFWFANVSEMFGKKGLVPRRAKLGIALEWMSRTSDQRGVKKITSFNRFDNEVRDTITIGFEPGTLQGNVILNTVLYIEEAADITENGERHLANASGTILGTFHSWNIVIDGNGSLFPIVDVEERNRPLWWVEFDYDDVFSDKFIPQYVKICLNKAHPDYTELSLDGTEGKRHLLKEVVAGALQVIYLKVMEDNEPDDIKNNENNAFEAGSIAQAINYFLNNFNWKVESIEDLAESIRLDLDERMK